MRKILPILTVLFALSPALAYAALTGVSQSSIYDGTYTCEGSGFTNSGSARAVFFNKTNGQGDVNTYGCASGATVLPASRDFSSWGYGTFTVLYVPSGTSSGCTGGGSSLSLCEANETSDGRTYTVYTVTYAPIPPNPQFGDIVNTATSSFNAATGFTLDSLVSFTWSTLIAPILGGGLALLITLRYPLIALVLITLIVYFAYRAWKTWRPNKF